MSVLYLLRHGQASFGQGDYDRLSALGLRQAEIMGEYLHSQGLALDAAYCGTMARQKDTAQAALERLSSPPPLTVLPEFNEYVSDTIIKALLPAMQEEDPSVLHALPNMYRERRSFQIVYEGAMRRWISGRYDVGEAETWPGFLERVGRAVDRVRRDNGRGKTVAVFTSGGPISAVMRMALGLADETALRLTWVIKNASISSFLYNDASLSLFSFNSTAHLEERKEAGLITYR